MPKTNSRSKYPAAKKHSLKFLLGTIAVLCLVIGLVVAAVMASMNQDLRQQAAENYKTCAGGILHNQKSCSGFRSVVMCKDGTLVPLANCAADQVCKSGNCVAAAPVVKDPECKTITLITVRDANSHPCQTYGKKSYECNVGYVNNGGKCVSPQSISKCKSSYGLFASKVANSSPCISGQSLLNECDTGYENKNNFCVPNGTRACASTLVVMNPGEHTKPCIQGSGVSNECQDGYVYAGGKCVRSTLAQCGSTSGLFIAKVAHANQCIFQKVVLYQCDTGYKNQNNGCVPK